MTARVREGRGGGGAQFVIGRAVNQGRCIMVGVHYGEIPISIGHQKKKKIRMVIHQKAGKKNMPLVQNPFVVSTEA